MRKPILAALAAAAAIAAFGGAQAGPPHCPPGHAKKGWCSPGEGRVVYVVPRDYRRVDDWRRHGLPDPRPGYVYAVYDEEVYLVLEATREVAEAIGAVARVLR
ncbi:MAG: RcnB family protein [Pseudomonadota bacterium]